MRLRYSPVADALGLVPRYSINYPRLSKALDRIAGTQIRATAYPDTIMNEHIETTEHPNEQVIPVGLYLDEAFDDRA